MSNQKRHVTMETVEDSDEPLLTDGNKGDKELNLFGQDIDPSEAPSEEERLSWREVDKMEETERRERENSKDGLEKAKETAHIVDDYVHHRR